MQPNEVKPKITEKLTVYETEPAENGKELTADGGFLFHATYLLIVLPFVREQNKNTH